MTAIHNIGILQSASQHHRTARQGRTRKGLNPPALPKLCYLWNSLIHKESPNHYTWGTVVAGLWAEEVSDEASWLGIWIQDLTAGLSKPALFLYLKAKTNKQIRFLNQSHSRESSGVDRDMRGEPPMASLLTQCYFWHHVLQGECELSQQAWDSSGHKGDQQIYSNHLSVCSRTSPCSLEHEHLNQLHIQDSRICC